jgi:hypothetical protein
MSAPPLLESAAALAPPTPPEQSYVTSWRSVQVWDVYEERFVALSLNEVLGRSEGVSYPGRRRHSSRPAL